MDRPAKVVRVALLNCERLQEHLAPEVFAQTGGYQELLQRTFDHVCKLRGKPKGTEAGGDTPRKVDDHPSASTVTKRSVEPAIEVQLTGFDAKNQEYPEDPKAFDGVLISGSLSGVYEKDRWIKRLLQEIRVYKQSKVRVCGISFGHQAVAQALGGKVTRNPKGSEVSARKSSLTPEAQFYFRTTKKAFRLLYHHNDTVVTMPAGFASIGGNNVTSIQGMIKGDQFLTFCGHPDYSHCPEVLDALLEYDREKLWVHEQLIEEGLKASHQRTDCVWVTNEIIQFYLGKTRALASTRAKKEEDIVSDPPISP